MVDAALQVPGCKGHLGPPHEARGDGRVQDLKRDSSIKNTLDVRKADFGLFQRRRICLEESHGNRPRREEGSRINSKLKSDPS